jgi:predicted TIM-barrel fold metal-dependent hydrolase
MQRIDIHHHMLPGAWIDEARTHKPDNTWGPNLLGWTPARAVAAMDAHGIATGITELGLPGVWWAAPGQSRRLARFCNEYAAGMMRDFPGRFGMFATLPFPDVDGSLAEIAYALDELQADGIGMLTSYGDVWAGHASFAPVYEELHRRAAVVHVHPTVPNSCIGLIPGISASTTEYLFDTARAIANLLHTRTAARYPGIRWIFSHGGGAFAPLTHRVLNLLSKNSATVRAELEAQLETFSFDVCTAVNAPAFAGLRALASVDRMLFGTDYPYVEMDETIGDLARLDLTAGERYAIERGNALRFFPRLAAQGRTGAA